MIRFQRTLQNAVRCEGVGLHTGRHVAMTMRPAPVDTGVVFMRTDLGGAVVEAVASNTAATNHATTLRRNGASVQTVEHLLGAFAGLGIMNVVVELDGDEVPILDGSAGPFIRMIVGAGIRVQEKIQPVLKVTRPVVVREGSRQLAIWPAERTSISASIDFNHPLLGVQCFTCTAAEEDFIREIADARTFGFLSDLETLRANGLARGGSLENAVVLGPDSVLNPEGLRYRDEFVRHKVLDVMGDLSLVGMPVIGHLVAHKAGHSLNALMVNRLLRSSLHWVLVGDPAAATRRHEAAAYYETAAVSIP